LGHKTEKRFTDIFARDKASKSVLKAYVPILSGFGTTFLSYII